MRIVLDTNIRVSATFWEGDSDKIIELIERKEAELILSKEILEEFAGVLEYREIQDKIQNKNLEMKRTVEKIASLSIIVEPQQKLDIIQEDQDDNKLLECAVAGKADFIISKDNHLLGLNEFNGIKIISPREFLEI